MNARSIPPRPAMPVRPALLGLLVTTTWVTAATAASYVYVSPRPESHLVSPHNNVVLRCDAELATGAAGIPTITVVGARSGFHAGDATLSDDGRTIVFTPRRPFERGERVQVRVAAGATTRGGARLPELEFGFAVAPVDPRLQPLAGREEFLPPPGAAPAAARRHGPSAEIQATGPLPASYPPIVIDLLDDPEPGHVFMSVNPPGATVHGNLVILDNRGEPVFYRRTPIRNADFRYQHRHLTYWDYGSNQFFALDSAYAVVDSFATGNGYVTDLHDFLWLPNGHALLMAYDPQPVRMDSIVACGNPNATVVGLIIQELDAAKNVVFQWRSWDHIPITDVAACQENLCASRIDYVHGNAFAVDYDGHILLSSRHLNEITKIDRQTGEILWRLGLHSPGNEFTFVNDTRGFSHQHDIRRLPNGHITLYDNGNCQDSLYSRGVEYHLDEVNKVATLVWEYRNTPDIYGRATGNLQRRPSGGTMINWGFAFIVTDLRPDDTKSLELHFGLANMNTYRAYRFPWKTSRFVTSTESIDFGETPFGDAATVGFTVRNDWDRDVTLTQFLASDTAFAVSQAVPLTLAPGATAPLSARFRPARLGEASATLYVRAVGDTELVARTIELHGVGIASTETGPRSGSAFAVTELSPNPSRGEARIAFEVPRESRIRLRVLDLQGRTVRTLADGLHAAGRHERIWDARAHGREHAGVYFVQLEWPGGRAVRRLALVP